MTPTRRAASAAALILLAPALAAAKCADADQSKACDLREHRPPHWVAGSGKGSITASVTAVCDSAPTRHKLTVWLEREASDGRTFLQVGNAQIWEKVIDFPPPPP